MSLVFLKISRGDGQPNKVSSTSRQGFFKKFNLHNYLQGMLDSSTSER